FSALKIWWRPHGGYYGIDRGVFPPAVGRFRAVSRLSILSSSFEKKGIEDEDENEDEDEDDNLPANYSPRTIIFSARRASAGYSGFRSGTCGSEFCPASAAA